LNQPGGLVDSQSGTIQFRSAGVSVLGGTFNAQAPARINLFDGIWTDSGGTTSGTGTIQIAGGTMLLRTNPIPGLLLAGADIYVTNRFQQAGAITNLTLEGATLHGTNTIGSGTLSFISGSIVDSLTVGPTGQLLLTTAAGKFFYNLSVTNNGTVTWSSGPLAF